MEYYSIYSVVSGFFYPIYLSVFIHLTTDGLLGSFEVLAMKILKFVPDIYVQAFL